MRDIFSNITRKSREPLHLNPLIVIDHMKRKLTYQQG